MKEANMQEVQAYLKECGAFFIATADGDQPHVRPFGVSEIIDGRLYIMTGKVKDVYKQIEKNGKFEICALKASGSEWMRLSLYSFSYSIFLCFLYDRQRRYLYALETLS